MSQTVGRSRRSKGSNGRLSAAAVLAVVVGLVSVSGPTPALAEEEVPVESDGHRVVRFELGYAPLDLSSIWGWASQQGAFAVVGPSGDVHVYQETPRIRLVHSLRVDGASRVGRCWPITPGAPCRGSLLVVGEEGLVWNTSLQNDDGVLVPLSDLGVKPWLPYGQSQAGPVVDIGAVGFVTPGGSIGEWCQTAWKNNCWSYSSDAGPVRLLSGGWVVIVGGSTIEHLWSPLQEVLSLNYRVTAPERSAELVGAEGVGGCPIEEIELSVDCLTVLAFEDEIVLIDGLGESIDSLAEPTAGRRFIALDSKGCGVLYASEEGGLGGAVVKVVPSWRDPGCFNDVGYNHTFIADIEWLGQEGVTKGCNPPANDHFCPEDHLTRGQMAAFINRALDLESNADDFFDDDTDSVFEADINALAAAGITKGCNPPNNDRFCPEDHVTRGQMAAFLHRALS